MVVRCRSASLGIQIVNKCCKTSVSSHNILCSDDLTKVHVTLLTFHWYPLSRKEFRLMKIISDEYLKHLKSKK